MKNVPELHGWKAKKGQRWEFYCREKQLHWELFLGPTDGKYHLNVRTSSKGPRTWVGAQGDLFNSVDVPGVFETPEAAVTMAQHLNRTAPPYRNLQR